MRQTIKFKIISYNILTICIIGIIFSISGYVTANKKAIEVAEKSLSSHVDSISDVYEIAYDEMMNILLNCTEGNMFELSKVGELLTLDEKRTGIEYAKRVRNFCAVTGYGEYISRLCVFNEDGLHVSAGTALSSLDDVSRVIDTEWFWREQKKDMNYYLLDLVDSPFYHEESKTLPIICKISGGEKESWAGIFLSPMLYMDEIKEQNSGNEMLVVTSLGKRVATLHETSEDFEENNLLIQKILEAEGQEGLFKSRVHGKNSIVAWARESRSGITTIEIMDMDLLKNDRMMLMQTIILIFIACLFLGVVLSVYFSHMVRKPIERLVTHIGHVAEGDFTQNPEIESADEIGKIGKVVNVMSAEIKQLMDCRIQDEKEKNDLELKMLQAQINPHFLYNTLDSIKWIAVIQKNSGIVKAVTALSKLLKNMAKGFHEKVTVREELDFVNDYVTIEKLKYAEMFDLQVEISEERLYQAKIVKLTLQPLVENAIFSGIEPTGRNGHITIKIGADEKCLLLVVSDDGVGIPKEKIEEILNDNADLKGDRMSSIGIANVNRRIKLIYGEAYGLSVESCEGVYTHVHIRIPLEFA